MKQGLIVGIVIIAALALGGFFLLAPAAATPGLLYIQHGEVEVNQGSGWTKAADEMELDMGDQVRTRTGEATVVLLEGEVIHLEADTHITIDTLRSKDIKINQLAGETWSKVTKISGISDYRVDTPSTVATVRGTEYYLTLFEVQVTEGTVQYWNKNTPQNKILVRKNNMALADELIEKPMTSEDKAKFTELRQTYIETLKKVRWREVKKHQRLLDMASKRGATEDDIKQWLDEVDNGVKSEDQLFHKVPVFLRPKAQRTYDLTKVIKQAIRDNQ